MVISYYGGKNKASGWIYSQITDEVKKNTKVFSEVFAGAFWLYANEDFSFVDKVIYNDKNEYLRNFFECIREPEFIELLEQKFEPGEEYYFEKDISTDPKEVYDYNYNKFKKLFNDLKQTLYKDKENEDIIVKKLDFDLAIKYGFMLRHAFSGIPSRKIGFSYSASSYKEGKKVPEPKSQILLRNINKDHVQNKLNKVTSFESLDYKEHIKKYDSEESLFYLDPPYYSTEANYFRGDEYFGRQGHEDLANILKQIKGKFILSYYEFDELKEFYPKDEFRWEIKEFTKASTSIKKAGVTKGREVLIMNF